MKDTTDVPLPDEDKSQYGWRVRWGQKIGQRTIAAGVVLEFEPDTTVASAAFDKRTHEYLRDKDIRLSEAGRGYCGDIRTGKYVEMDWIRREG